MRAPVLVAIVALLAAGCRANRCATSLRKYEARMGSTWWSLPAPANGAPSPPSEEERARKRAAWLAACEQVELEPECVPEGGLWAASADDSRCGSQLKRMAALLARDADAGMSPAAER